ncbi:hypothetical protein B7463_g5797, partial [Scytalidium lignicola]
MVKADLSRDYYGDLDLPPSADTNEIKKQFKKLVLTQTTSLALIWHPDRNPGREAEVTTKFQRIQSAHEVLTDLHERARYDAARSRSKSFASSGYASHARGNPYATSGSQWPPPPKPPTARKSGAPPPSHGAQKYKNFEPPKPSTYNPTQEGAQARTNMYTAWENMKSSQKPNTSQGWQGVPNQGPTAAQAFGTRRADRASRQYQQSTDYTSSKYGPDDGGYRKYSVPPRDRDPFDYFGEAPGSRGSTPRRSRSTGAAKRTGFMPSDPEGDEPPAANTSAYFTRRSNPPPTSTPNDFSAQQSPRASKPMADPLKQFREQTDNPCEPRLSTPYATHGGEKTNPFDIPDLTRSKSTREPPTPFPTARPSSSAADVPRTSSDPNLGSKNRNGTARPTATGQSRQQARRGMATDPDSSDSDYMPRNKPTYKPPTFEENREKVLFAEARKATAAKPNQPVPNIPLGGTPKAGPTSSKDDEGARMYATSHNLFQNLSHSQHDFQNSFKDLKQDLSKNRRRASSPKLPTVLESMSAKDNYFRSRRNLFNEPYNMREPPTKWQNTFLPEDSGLPFTPPSGGTDNSLNAFETVQRSIVDQIISKSKSDIPKRARQHQSLTSEVTPTRLPYQYQKNGRIQNTSSENDDAIVLLNKHIQMESSTKKQKIEKQSSDSLSYWADSDIHPWQPLVYSRLNANVRGHPSFDFNLDDDIFSTSKPQDKKPTSTSAENIGRTFSPKDWDGKFDDADFFTPEQRAENVKGRPGPKSRGRSPPKPRPGEAKVQSQREMPEASTDPPPSQDPQTQNWAQYFKPPTFIPPPPAKPRAARSTGRKPRAPRSTSAVVDDDDDEDSSDAPPLFMGRNATKPASASKNGTKNGASMDAGSPDAMDIDSPPAVKSPVPATPDVPVTPTIKKTPSHRPPSLNTTPNLTPHSEDSKRAKRGSAPPTANGNGGSINLDSLKQTEPIKQPASSGLNSFDDLFASLPFESRASLILPTTESFIPMAPLTPSTLTQASYADYIAEFKTYMTQWGLFNSRLVLHFVARKKQTVQFSNDFVENMTDGLLNSYLEGLHEDQNLRTKWFEATQVHEVALRDFQGVQLKAKSLGLGKTAN